MSCKKSLEPKKITLTIAIMCFFLSLSACLDGGIKTYKDRPPTADLFPTAASFECDKYYWISDSPGIDSSYYGFLFLTDTELSRLKGKYEWTEVDVYVEFEKEDYQLTTREKTEAELEFESELGFNMYNHPVSHNSSARMLIPHNLTKSLESYEGFDWRYNEVVSNEFKVPFTFGEVYLDIKNGIIYFYCYTM